MSEVPRQTTPHTDAELVPGLIAGLTQRIGSTPVRQLAEMLLAQIRFEGNLNNNNVGNLQATKSWTGDYWRPPWFDQAAIDAITDPVLKAKRQAQHDDMLVGRAPEAFKAFNTIEEGLNSYLDLLFKPLYHPLLAAAATGDPVAFATEVHKHYTPDASFDVTAVAKTLGSLVKGFQAKGLFDMLPKVPPAGPAPEPPSSPPPPWPLGPSDVVAPDPAAPLYTLRKGVHGALVALWQKTLREHGFSVTLTGVFDLPTETATKAYQASLGLEDDGIVGRITWSSVLT